MSQSPKIIHAHLNGRCDLTLYNNFVYTVGPDFFINKFDAVKYQMVKDFPKNVDGEYYSIHIDPYSKEENKILTGSSSGKLEKLNIDGSLDDPYLFLETFDSIYRIISSQLYVACSSGDKVISIFKKTNEKVYKPSKGHEGSCLNLCFDSENSKFVASTSCDGTINIYKLENKNEDLEIDLVKNMKISKECTINGEQVLKPMWNPSGNILGLPGNASFAVFVLENNNFTYQSDSKIMHEKDISIIQWISNEILATVGLDKKIKVWNYLTKELLTSYSCNDYIQSLIYDSINHQLIFIDTNGQLGFCKDELFTKKISSLPPEQSADKAEKNNNKDSKIEILDSKTEEKLLETKPDEKERKKAYIKSDADTWIDAIPQEIIHSSSSTIFKMRRFLSWNFVGTIILRKDNEFSFLDIDFSDKKFHKNIRTRDVYNISMGTMNHMGAILASKAESINENEYENELDKDETKKSSYIQYKSFTYTYEAYDWTHKLQKKENAECVCIGSTWCAVATDFNFLRIFNLVGIELNVINYEKRIVCMAGYENLLAYVIHDSVPISGAQNLKLIIFDVNSMKIMKECHLPVTPYSTLSWFGFSQEGLLILQEHTGIIKAFFNESSFITLYDIEEGNEKKKFWLVGMMDYEIIGVGLNKDELEPGCFPLPQTKILNINLPFIKNPDNVSYEKILWKKLILEHEKFRKKMWSELKFSREANDALFIYSNSIMNDSEIAKAEIDLEKMLIDYFRKFLDKGEFEKAISVVSTMIKQLKTVEFCIVLCNKLDLRKVADKLNNILIARKKIAEFEAMNKRFGQQMTLNNTAKETSSLLNNENFQASKPKNKIDLRDLVIHKQTSLTSESIQLKSKKPSNKLPEFNSEEFEVKEDEDETNENEKNTTNPSLNKNNEQNNEPKNILDLMEQDNKKKRKMVEEEQKVNKKLKFEKAKLDLENLVIERLKDAYVKENQKAKLKNDEGKKSDKDESQIDKFLDILSKNIKLIDQLATYVQTNRKLKEAEKLTYHRLLAGLKGTLEKFVKEKLMPVKPTEWIFSIVSQTEETLNSINHALNPLNNAGFCSVGRYKKSLVDKVSRMKEIAYFWEGLVHSTAREGYQERHLVPEFNEKEMRKDLKKMMDDNFPHEQEPQIREVIKRVETGTKPDNIKEAHELLFGFGRPQNIIQALQIYHMEADTNDPNVNACICLGRIYSDGQFIPRDYRKAYFYYQQATTKDLTGESEYRIGSMIENDLIQSEELASPEIRSEAAREYYESAAQKENLDALTDLGFYYSKRDDFKTAIEYYKRAKKKKFPRALNNLGKLYLEYDEEAIKDDNSRKAVKYFELAMNYGNIKAIYNLGVCYDKGIGVQQNYEKACDLFKEAAKKGDLEAKLFYSAHLLRRALGEDSEDSFIEAMHMLRDIIHVEPNNAEANYYLGYLFENGFGVQKDFKIALSYYNKAAQLDHPPSLNKVGDFCYSGCGMDEPNFKRSYEAYVRSAELGNPDALINLGTLYENGSLVTERNPEKACLYYQHAAELQDSRGYLNLGHMIETGLVKPNNQKDAMFYYEVSANLGNNNAKEIISIRGRTTASSFNSNGNEKFKEGNIDDLLKYNPSMKNSSVYKNKKLQESDQKIKKNYQSYYAEPVIPGYLTSGISKENAEYNKATYGRMDGHIESETSRLYGEKNEENLMEYDGYMNGKKKLNPSPKNEIVSNKKK